MPGSLTTSDLVGLRWKRGLDALSLDGIAMESGFAADASDKGISK
jgi:hypothetical protein